MPNHEPLEDIDLELMPHWAIGRANGELVLGAQLPTRDGRRCGNGHIVAIAPARWDPDVTLSHVLTDAGTHLKLTGEEVTELYYQPIWVSDVYEVLLKFKDRDQLPKQYRRNEPDAPDAPNEPTGQ